MQFKVIVSIFKDYGVLEGFQQIGISTKEFLSTFKGQAIATTAIITATYKAIDYLQSSWTRAGEAAEKATSDFESANSELESLKSQKVEQQTQVQEIAAKYDIDTTELQDVNGELKGVDQMIATVNSHGGISLVDQAELNSISSANSQLEAQLAIQEQITEAKKQAMILATEKAANTEKTYYEQMKEEYGAIEGFFKWIQGQAHVEIDKNGQRVSKDKSDSDKFYGESGDSTNLGLFKTRIAELKEYKSELKTIDDDIANSKKNGDKIAQDTIDRRNELVDSITNSSSDLATLVETISSQMEILSQSDSDFALSWVEDAKKALNDFNNIDLSQEEQQLNAINSFFDGSTKSNSIKDRITDMINSGEVKSATDALHKMGLTLNDLGITGEGRKAAFNNYFSGLIKSAEEAQSAIKSIDGSVEGVKSAFESYNQDADWNSMSDLLKQADELYKNGKVGTDDFKAAAQFMSPTLIDPDSTKYDADAYVAAWEAARGKIQRYFDSENPLQSAANFTNDLVDKELAIKDASGDVTWQFESSAEAAEALGLSVEAAEVAMHNLESYGAEFDDVMFSGEGLKRYETALDSIKTIRDSMNDGKSKERLDGLIDNWDSELERYQTNISTLTEDQVVHIEFEYDLASIQAQIDKLMSEQKAQGRKNAVTNASIISTNEEYVSTAKEGLGLNNKDVDFSVQFKPADDAIDNLYSQLQEAESGSDEYFDIQAKIQNAQEIQKDLLNSFSEQNPEITADSNIDEIISAWRNFFGQEQHFTVEGELDAESIEAQMESLTSGSTIQFTCDVDGIDGVENEVTALKNEDGTITYTSNVDGVNVPLSVTEKDGKIIFKADTKEVDAETAKTDGGTREVSYLADTSGLPSFFSPITRTVNYVATGAGMAMAGNAMAMLGGKASASGTLLSPSHANGTAYNMLNLKPAYADGKVSLSKNENALVNELGTESLIRDGVWSLLPGKMHVQSLKKGDIILNAKQTEDLLKSGKTNSHAKSYANGTLLNSYANGFRLPTGIANNSSYSSSVNNSSSNTNNTVNRSTSSAASAVSKAAEDLKDFVEIYLDRASDLTQKQIDAIDRAVGLADKQNQNAKAISNVQSEITKNRQAYDRYMQQANSVGLSESYASQIRDGSLNIENITDETLSKNIKSYEEWYNKAKDCLDKVTELQDKERELAIERLEQIEDFYKLVNDVQEALQKANDAKLDFSDAMGFSAVSDTVRKTYQESLNAAEEIYTNLTQQLVDYQNEFNDLISKGYIQKYSDEWYEGYAKIHEFNEAIDSAGVSIVDFEDKIREITYTKIQQLIDGFERAMDKLDARIDLMESRDETVPESLYQKQLDANNSRISGNKEMRDAKLAEQALYAVDSKRYQELAEEINKLDTETLGLMKDNEKLKDTIFELRFTPLEDGIEKMESLRDELKDFMDLLNEDAYFDKEGRITSEGVAALALLEQSMSSAKQEIADYREGLDKLQESFDNGVISEVEFNEKSEEYRKGIRDSIADVQDYSEALTKLYLNQMKQENEYLQKIIDKRKEALKTKADYYDYDKKIRGQSKDVNMLKAQIAALEGVNNASAQAELKRLKQQLSDAEDELSETKRDHAIDMQEKGYDTMSDELNEILENTEYEIVHNADKQQSVIQSMLQNVVSMYSSAYGKINEIIHNTGWVGSTDFNSNQSELSTQEGAANQVSGSTQHQSNVGSTGTAQSTVTSPIKNNDSFNHDFEQEIYKDPNVDNRPVAELKLSKKSITLEEGKSTSVSVQIRPTDAKNKTLSWKSSNEKVATVSNGTIKAVKPGSCQITASTTDGSGISASVGVTVTKKPDPPKPVVKPPSSSSRGDGVPRVGDVVTLLSGQRYYYDSWGTSPAGNKYAGIPNGVVIDGYSGSEYGGQSSFHGGYGVHIRSADGVYGNLGWVSLSQIAGYNKGTKNVPKDGLALFDETADGKSDPGSEVIITKYGTLRQFKAGDRVFANDQVQRLWELSNGKGISLDYVPPQPPVTQMNQVMPVSNTQNVELHIDKLLNIEDGVITKDTIPDVKNAIKDCIPMIKKEISNLMYSDAVRTGVRRKR